MYWIRKRLGFGIDISRKMLDDLGAQIGRGHIQNRNIRKFDCILDRENLIKYRDEYIREAFGGLGLEDIPPECDLFSEEDVILFLTIFFLDGNYPISNGEYDKIWEYVR